MEAWNVSIRTLPLAATQSAQLYKKQLFSETS